MYLFIIISIHVWSHWCLHSACVWFVCVVKTVVRVTTNFELAVYLSAADDDDDDAKQIKGFRFQTHSDHTTPRDHARVANNNDTQ